MSKYAALDTEILDAIRTGFNTSSWLVNKLSESAKPFANKDYRGRLETDRVIDGRLQALRKKNQIVYANGKWELA